MKYFLAVGLCCALVSAVLSRNVMVKRNNAYGDEPVKPEGAAAAVEAGPSPSAPAADAPAASAPAPEQSSAAVAQPAPESTASKASGYRKKRNNQYGDEPVKTQMQHLWLLHPSST
uniref:Uncharacterized protein n=1 Tax=Ditylenchus dipsaci TaxID=166011 RepID=A0A915DC91_9BILA